MSQILEIKSKSIEDAITNALEQLSVSREDIEVEVIENPVKGFLGLIGNKDGKYKFIIHLGNFVLLLQDLHFVLLRFALNTPCKVHLNKQQLLLNILRLQPCLQQQFLLQC